MTKTAFMAIFKVFFLSSRYQNWLKFHIWLHLGTHYSLQGNFLNISKIVSIVMIFISIQISALDNDNIVYCRLDVYELLKRTSSRIGRVAAASKLAQEF